MRSPSYGDKLTHKSFSGTVSAARKYLIRRSYSSSSARPAKGFSPGFMRKSNCRGFSGWMVMPLRSAGVYSGLKPTLTPGVGKINGICAKEGGAIHVVISATISEAAITRKDKGNLLLGVKLSMIS